jgi:propionate CoA-transferase
VATDGWPRLFRYRIRSLGGYPRFGSDFGIADNPVLIFDTADVLQFYNGEGLDLTMLGFGQMDAAGNVNVSEFT